MLTIKLYIRYDLGICNNIINDLGNVSPELPVPDHIIKPDYFYEYKQPTSTLGVPEIKTNSDINRMRTTCQIAAKILKNCADIIKVPTYLYFSKHQNIN